MPLPPGTRLGQYDVLGALGAGGMGEVYRARDTKLGREVALKILPESVVHDAERLARFRREAQLLAALNHPHIGGIHGFEEAGSHQFLVLELIEGETLAARLQRGAIPVTEALDIAREIAAALEAAHDKGIVHRDLKPSNIAFSGEGTAKVLDFGLANPTAGSAAEPDSNVVNSPTITSPLTLTGLGVILGTAAYMSPEQAKGAVADKRADVWAFGCVLYEMLTGRRAFPGDDVTDTLAAVIRSQPEWTALPESLSPPVRMLPEGCLEKDRRKRIADLSVVRFVLDRRSALTDTALRDRPARPAWMLALLLLGGAGIGAAAAIWWGRETPPPPPDHAVHGAAAGRVRAGSHPACRDDLTGRLTHRLCRRWPAVPPIDVRAGGTAHRHRGWGDTADVFTRRSVDRVLDRRNAEARRRDGRHSRHHL